MKTCKTCDTAKEEKYFRPQNRECRRCGMINANKKRKERYEKDPILWKASHTIGGLQWGRGGAMRMSVLVRKYLGTPCKYCNIELTIKNMSLDHKIPLPHAARKASKATQYSRDITLSKEDIIRLNEEDNLHFVCLTCNRAKGNMTDEEYSSLLEFLSDKQHMKMIVLAKLKGGNFMFGRK